MSKPPVWDIYGAHWIDHNPNKRFAIYSSAGNGDVVLDKETGLVWERSPSAQQFSWDPAILQGYIRKTGGRKGWRLPAMEELLSLVDPAQSNPTLPVGHPFVGIRTDYFYWSGTLGSTAPPTYAWGYNFGNGDTSNVLKTAQAYIWFVRGGFGHDYPH